MGNQASRLKSSHEFAPASIKLLATMKRVLSSPVEARGMAAAALAVLLKLRPENQDISTTEDGQEDVSIDKSDVLLFFEALIDSVDERIAALTRVLEAPEDDPQEVAAARAELARSKAYPGPLWGAHSQAGGSAGPSGDTRGNILGLVSVPKEERYALELYQMLLVQEEGRKADRPELDVLPDEGETDKEALQIELQVQKIYRSRLSERKGLFASPIVKMNHTEDPYVNACQLSEGKHAIYDWMNAAKSVRTVEVESNVMKTNEKASGVITRSRNRNPANYPLQIPEQAMIELTSLDLEDVDLLGVYESPFCDKVEKLNVLMEIISNRNLRKHLTARYGQWIPHGSRDSEGENDQQDCDRSLASKEKLTSSDSQNKAVSEETEKEAKPPDAEQQLPSDKTHEDFFRKEHAKPTADRGDDETLAMNLQVGSSQDGTKTKSFNNMLGANPPGTREGPKESAGDLPELSELRRVFTPPLTRADMVSALSRVLRWREQLLSKSQQKHRAHDYKQVVKEALDGFKHDALCETAASELSVLASQGKTSEHSDSGVRDLVIEDILLSGSVQETTEVHVCTPDPSDETFRASTWLSGDKLTAMTHWCIRKLFPPMQEGESSNAYELSPTKPFKQASDVDLMLQLGPVKLCNGLLQSDSSPLGSDSNSLQSDSSPLQSDSNLLQGDSNLLQGDSNPLDGDSNPLDGDSNPLKSDPNQLQSDSNLLLLLHSESNPLHSNLNPLQNGSHQLQCKNQTENKPNPKTSVDIGQKNDDALKLSDPCLSSRDPEPNSKVNSTAPSQLEVLTLLVDDCARPGFVYLRPALQRNGQYSVRDTLHFLVFGEQIRKACIGENLHMNSLNGIHGPAISPRAVHDSNVGQDDSVDLVPFFICPEWDSSEYMARERPSGQPSQALVDELCRMPIYLVSVEFGFSAGKSWRKSFSRQESVVIRSMTKPQRICLVLLKHCAAVTQSSLKSYHLKTAMMWVCETRAPELWTWEGMLESMEAVLDFLQKCMQENLVLPCYFCPEINLWLSEKIAQRDPFLSRAYLDLDDFAVVKLRLLVPRAIQLLLAGLLSSSQAPLMRHLLGLPLDAQEFLWCCWKRSVNDPALGASAEATACVMYPHAVEGRLWSEHFLDTFKWEKLPARCKEPTWFADHGLDTDSEGEED